MGPEQSNVSTEDEGTNSEGDVQDCVRLRQIELEVELPRRRPGRIVSAFVHERQAELDDLQQIHVAPQQLVLVVHCAAELTDRPDHHPGEFCVLTEQ